MPNLMNANCSAILIATVLLCSTSRAEDPAPPAVSSPALAPAPGPSTVPPAVDPAVFDKMQQQLSRIKTDTEMLNQSYAQMGHDLTLLQADARYLAESTDPDRLLRENMLLKSIIQRQVAEERARAATVKEARDELKKLGVKSPALETQIKIIEMSQVELTPREKAVLSKP